MRLYPTKDLIGDSLYGGCEIMELELFGSPVKGTTTYSDDKVYLCPKCSADRGMNVFHHDKPCGSVALVKWENIPSHWNVDYFCEDTRAEGHP